MRHLRSHKKKHTQMQHLNESQRYTIYRMRKDKKTQSEIARYIGVSQATVSKEQAGRHEEVQGVGGRRDHGVDQDGAVTPQIHNVGSIDQENARDGETAQGIEEMESDGGGDRRAHV